jgi:ribosome-binding protein aMBF1 (putative translation factor)
MKKSGYMDRALRASDPRFARVLGKLGYQRSDMAVQAEIQQDELTNLRAEYQRIYEKRAYHGWSAAELRAKISEAVDSKEDNG